MGDNSRMTADVAELKRWSAEADSEIEAVKATLDRVGKVCSELDKDDTINGWFISVGNAIAEEYLEMCNTFQQCSKLTNEVIDLIKKGVTNIGEVIAKFTKLFHR